MLIKYYELELKMKYGDQKSKSTSKPHDVFDDPTYIENQKKLAMSG